jgi:uncharacterized membrane protein
MSSKKEKFAWLVIMTLSLIGVVGFGVIIHEYSHYYDFKELNVSNGEICGLILPIEWKNWSEFQKQALGSYSFNVDDNKRDRFNEIDKYTEIKAYFINIIIGALFLVCFTIIIFFKYKNEFKIINQEQIISDRDLHIKKLENYINYREGKNK